MDKTAATALFAWLDREVWLVTSQAGEKRGALIATFVNQASIVPEVPRVVIGLARHHHTWTIVEESGAFGLHLLGEPNLEWVAHFGLHTGHNGDKLAGWTTEAGVTGSPLLSGAIGWMDCRVETKVDTGDRTLYVAEVVESCVTNYAPPLTLKQLLQVAPKEYLSEMKRLMGVDSILDLEAIRAWRAKRGIPTESAE